MPRSSGVQTKSISGQKRHDDIPIWRRLPRLCHVITQLFLSGVRSGRTRFVWLGIVTNGVWSWLTGLVWENDRILSLWLRPVILVDGVDTRCPWRRRLREGTSNPVSWRSIIEAKFTIWLLKFTVRKMTFIADTPTLRVMMNGFDSIVKPTIYVQQTEN